MPFRKGTPTEIATEGFTDAQMGIASDGFIVDVTEEEVIVAPGGGHGFISPAKRVKVIIDWRRIKRRREDLEILELL